MRCNPTPNDYVRGTHWMVKDMAEEAYAKISHSFGPLGHNHIWRTNNPESRFCRSSMRLMSVDT